MDEILKNKEVVSLKNKRQYMGFDLADFCLLDALLKDSLLTSVFLVSRHQMEAISSIQSVTRLH